MTKVADVTVGAVSFDALRLLEEGRPVAPELVAPQLYATATRGHLCTYCSHTTPQIALPSARLVLPPDISPVAPGRLGRRIFTIKGRRTSLYRRTPPKNRRLRLHLAIKSMRREWSIILSVALAGFATGFGLMHFFFLGHSFLPPPAPPFPRLEISLPRNQLRSVLAGQPLPASAGYVADAKKGHKPGHIVYSLPQKLTPGNYALEIELNFVRPGEASGKSCILDLVNDTRVVRAKYPHPFQANTQVKFRSPGPTGDPVFTARLFCDGSSHVRVKSVQFVRNPDTPKETYY